MRLSGSERCLEVILSRDLITVVDFRPLRLLKGLLQEGQGVASYHEDRELHRGSDRLDPCEGLLIGRNRRSLQVSLQFLVLS